MLSKTILHKVTVTQTATNNVKHKYCATPATFDRQPSQKGKLH